ncbi:MAG: hypothetical protein KDD78_21025, partial [Caldilineaceae bacterium]|nr:hypothetical protein [Caldilineaceae bacterium]
FCTGKEEDIMLRWVRRWLMRMGLLAIVLLAIQYTATGGALQSAADHAKRSAMRHALGTLETDYANPLVEEWAHAGAQALFDWLWQHSDGTEQESIRYYIELRRDRDDESWIILEIAERPPHPSTTAFPLSAAARRLGMTAEGK